MSDSTASVTVTDALLRGRQAALESGAKLEGETVPVLCDLTAASESIDGLAYSQMVVAGFIHLQRNHAHL